MEYIIYVAIAGGAFFIGYLVRQKKASTSIESAEKKSEKIISEAKNKQNTAFALI